MFNVQCSMFNVRRSISPVLELLTPYLKYLSFFGSGTPLPMVSSP